MTFLKDHKMSRELREVPTCDHCGTPLQPLYYLCECGRELHISCRREHESFVKMRYKHATAPFESCEICTPSSVCEKHYNKIMASKAVKPEGEVF